MNKKLQTTLKKFSERMNLLEAIGSAQSLLSWDRETHMPKGASSDRGQTMGVLAGFAHDLFTDKKFVNMAHELYEAREELSPEDRRCMILAKRELDKSVKLTKEFVEETNVLMNAAYNAWVEAKTNDNFALYKPHLEAVVENRKQYAHFLNPDMDPYDLNLDEYEEGMCRETLEPMFTNLKDGLKKLLPQILAKQQPSTNPLNGVRVDHEKLRQFLKEMVTTIGFDMNRGGMGSVEHPFEITISYHDTRLNTKFTNDEQSFTIVGMVHELGHGLYEQNVDEKHVKHFLDNGVSLGIHESQSRFLENMVGRSPEFWQFFLPKLQSYCPEFAGVKGEEIVRALNHVQPSLIRTESDEVTYNLHIILRFELENALIHDQLKVKDLPELWRAKMKELVGVEPATDREGVMQDVHWAWGNIGYFPTYTLGNLNAAQLLVHFTKAHPNWRAEVAEGNFSSYVSWFKEKVWQHGSFLKPEEVMIGATGENTNAKYFLEYLSGKYL